jgi:hypothetical protein
MDKQIVIVNPKEIRMYENRIIANTRIAIASLQDQLRTLEGIEALRLMKFTKCGGDPFTGEHLNLVEQINQTFTYLVCLEAVRVIMERHPDRDTPYVVSFGSKGGFDVMTKDGSIVCDCFASVRPDRHGQLIREVRKVSGYSDAKYKYVVFYAVEKKPALLQRIQVKYPDVVVIPLEGLGEFS